jgi:hypothetical protein
VLAGIGINLGKPRKGLVFEIRSEEGNEARSYVEWLEEFDGDMDDFRRDQEKKRRVARTTDSEGKLAECRAAFLEILNREKWLPSKTLDEELRLRCGHTPRTIERARNELRDAKRIGIERFGIGSSHKWFTGLFGTDPRGSTHVRAEWTSRLEVARRSHYTDRD